MRKVIFITRSLNISCIKDNLTNTSSQLFELGITRALSKKINLQIVHLGSINIDEVMVDKCQFTSVNYRSIFGFFRLFRTISKMADSTTVKIITTGYYPIEIFTVIIASKLFGMKTFSYVYDTHYQATAKMSYVKRMLANIYFSFGFYWVKKSTALLVLNDFFVRSNTSGIHYFKTKIGVSSGSIVAKTRSQVHSTCDVKTLVFAGTINPENGANILIEFVRQNTKVKFELHFYGDGESTSAIQALAEVDDRVKYFGRVSESELQEKLQCADLLISLRDPDGSSKNYSFPSKLINFMATGVPVISNRFHGLDDSYFEYLYIVENFDASSVAKKLLSILEIGKDMKLGDAARQFVRRENSWDQIADQLIEFMK